MPAYILLITLQPVMVSQDNLLSQRLLQSISKTHFSPSSRQKEKGNVIGYKRYLPPNAEKFSKIVKLPMNITTNCHGAFDRLHSRSKEINKAYLITHVPAYATEKQQITR